MSYISPITVDFIDELIDKMVETAQKEQEIAVMKRVKMVVDVDKDELVKALQYDRNQYDKGYQEGYYEAIEKVRAKLKEIDVEFNYLDSLISQI